MPETSRPPLVSVLISVLNPDPVYFREAVESILAQTISDLELVVVEDPSERCAEPTLAQIGDPRVRYFRNPQRTSLVRQRNQALAHARGALVALIDADDVARPDRLARQVGYLQEHPEVAVVGSWIEAIDPRGETIGYRAYPVSDGAIRRAMRLYNPIAQPAVMCRREVVLEAGGYTYDRHPATEDYDLWCRLAKRGVRFANLPEPLLRYRIHPGGMKASKLRGILRGTLEVKKTYWASEMSLGDRLRMWGERLLLVIPAPVVLAFFARTHYHAGRTVKPAPGASS